MSHQRSLEMLRQQAMIDEAYEQSPDNFTEDAINYYWESVYMNRERDAFEHLARSLQSTQPRGFEAILFTPGRRTYATQPRLVRGSATATERPSKWCTTCRDGNKYEAMAIVEDRDCGNRTRVIVRQCPDSHCKYVVRTLQATDK
jgi:hypothetical protein